MSAGFQFHVAAVPCRLDAVLFKRDLSTSLACWSVMTRHATLRIKAARLVLHSTCRVSDIEPRTSRLPARRRVARVLQGHLLASLECARRGAIRSFA